MKITRFNHTTTGQMRVKELGSQKLEIDSCFHHIGDSGEVNFNIDIDGFDFRFSLSEQEVRDLKETLAEKQNWFGDIRASKRRRA